MIKVNKDRLIEEFLELVQIDSETKYESEISSILKEKFKNLGLDVVEDSEKELTGHGAGNLICSLKGTKIEAEQIYFTSHMDTVVRGKGVKTSIKYGYIVTEGRKIIGSEDKAGIEVRTEAI